MSEITIPTRWMNEEPTHTLRLVNVHQYNERCEARGCVIHNPSTHHMRYWPLHWRDDRGIFERICPAHGIGHPDPDQFGYWCETGQEWQSVHGCCGCCRP